MKWDTCCKSIKEGGIGLRRMVPKITSFLMKLAYNFVTKANVLWVRVLCSQSKVDEASSRSISRNICSYV